ncbi:hypothetical protein [Haloarchaeobius amylolyticus]|uniref:hypothetical protein n=1 Tax=Haloarchaeobius amylolyticus TaxID=1198296 RepID=UPI0022709165|nr:hypothetical protein [Haloarchaeobius amylolyticus]
MNTETILQLFAGGLFVVGLVALGLSNIPLDGVAINTDDAFAAGVIFTSVGFIMFADVRRRMRRTPKSP